MLSEADGSSHNLGPSLWTFLVFLIPDALLNSPFHYKQLFGRQEIFVHLKGHKTYVSFEDGVMSVYFMSIVTVIQIIGPIIKVCVHKLIIVHIMNEHSEQ